MVEELIEVVDHPGWTAFDLLPTSAIETRLTLIGAQGPADKARMADF
ncbi:hypothetical protein [Streptomyces sp. NPDC058475]